MVIRGRKRNHSRATMRLSDEVGAKKSLKVMYYYFCQTTYIDYRHQNTLEQAYDTPISRLCLLPVSYIDVLFYF